MAIVKVEYTESEKAVHSFMDDMNDLARIMQEVAREIKRPDIEGRLQMIYEASLASMTNYKSALKKEAAGL